MEQDDELGFDFEIRLPAQLSERFPGVVEDAEGNDLFTVDVNGELTDTQATIIAERLVALLNR